MSCKPDKHKYEPRYDYTPFRGEFKRCDVATMEAVTRGKYIRDICIKCGDTIEGPIK